MGTDSTPTVERLQREVTGDAPDLGSGPERWLSGIDESLMPTEFEFDEELVKHDLSALLVPLVADSDGANGKQLMETLEETFDTTVSPGTAYPLLHDLEAEDVFEMRELVRTKEYVVGDEELARERVEAAMRQHLSLGFFLYSALEEL